MSPLAAAGGVWACTFGGALAGMLLGAALPAHHLNEASKSTVNVGIALIATMTALILGLVTASAKSTFDASDQDVRRISAEVLSLDRILARYGPETAPVRKALHDALAARVERVWPPSGDAVADFDPVQGGAELEQLVAALHGLTPKTDDQRWLQGRAEETAESLLASRWLAFGDTHGSVPHALLVIVVFWLSITFVSFGMFAPPNGTVLTILFLCALSVAAAVFLILELEQPLTGLIRISPEPLRYAIAHLAQ
ncbi:MAG TPA: hypothetical protein VMR86_02550 [Myxococcota bacterium]|nr:hypothetical protein [Myxococcota bacterium]